MDSDMIFDQRGNKLVADVFLLARKLGYTPISGVIDHAVRDLGFVRIRSLRSCLLVEFEPTTVRYLAAWSAFYEIMGRAPRRVVLAHPDRADGARPYEVLPNAREAVRRVEEFALGVDGRRATRDRPLGRPPSRHLDIRRKPEFTQPTPSVPVPCKIFSFRGRDGLAVRTLGADCSQRIHQPIDAISAADLWMGRALGIWRNARPKRNLPSIESLDLPNLPGISGGKVHILDTSAGEPEGYWFRHWGRNNSYPAGHDNLSLGRMPCGLMREAAIEDYGRVVTAAAPCYSLISIVEGSRAYSYGRVILPLAARGRRADHILVLINERELTPEPS